MPPALDESVKLLPEIQILCNSKNLPLKIRQTKDTEYFALVNHADLNVRFVVKPGSSV
jgi:hypothetical protein